MEKRDPLKDPMVGDQLQAVWRIPMFHQGNTSILTIEALVGNLVATSSTGSKEIRWQRFDECFATDCWISGWEVVYAVAEATDGL